MIVLACAIVVFGAIEVVPQLFQQNSSPTIQTEPVPPTQTSCPASGTARAAVTAPLALGTDQNLVYLEETKTLDTFTSYFKRYDVQTRQITQIAKLDNILVTNNSTPEISSDGQWLLFVSGQQTQALTKLQMIRMDGQGLQTLLCENFIHNFLWSPDLTSVVFQESGNSSPIFLLNLSNGNLRAVYANSSAGPASYIPTSWQDSRHVFVLGSDHQLASLDITQQNTSPQLIAESMTYCSGFSNSVSEAAVYIFRNQNCNASQSSQQNTSTVTKVILSNETTSTIYNSSSYYFGGIQVVDGANPVILFIVDNRALNSGGDTSQDGLWKMKTDGTDLVRLATTQYSSSGGSYQGCFFDFSSLNSLTQDAWSNISRDGSFYSMECEDGQTFSLLYGSLQGGPPTTLNSFTNSSSSTDFSLGIGWTTM